VSETPWNADPDRMIHEPARLRIVAILSVAREADFTYLLRETGLTRGNLSVQLTRLEEAGYVVITKTFVGRTPRTLVKLTAKGRGAFAQYRGFLAGLLAATQ
jgi:DNA-binding MarR family transcriptional regulator